MKPDARFLNRPKCFWAYVRFISQQVGYSIRGKKKISVPLYPQMKKALEKNGLHYKHLVDEKDAPTELGQILYDYFVFRANILNSYVGRRLMDSENAKKVFEKLYNEFSPTCPIPMNKQKGEKKAPAYFTAIINMIIEKNGEGLPFNFDPRELITVTSDNILKFTLSRRVDGAFPSVIDPIAIWEIKEYYYTTTFGSRVADGVYETLLDGMEISELSEKEGIDVKHYFMIDSHFTWWDCGRPYLCRLIDALHMGYIDELLVGYEVIERLPSIVKEWIKLYKTT
ncbi:MAG: hypothetical protein U9P14_06115 [Gemmatimonadota bacterium]|nr:hypothetical protein [Gemmatimonadota bacterium]